MVTGGGLSDDGKRWIAGRNSFLLPVRALSKIIRGKFLEALEKACREGRLRGQVPGLADPVQFRRLTRKLSRKKWVVYAKGSFGGSQKAYYYLSRYTHRVAIANHRLVSLAEGKVSFQARDNSRPGHKRLVTLTAPEFIRRFLLHVLPPRFVKIRHFGLMAPGNAKTKLEQARALLSLQSSGSPEEPKNQELDPPSEAKTWQEMLRALTGVDLTICPNCGQGRLIRCRLLGSEAPWRRRRLGFLMNYCLTRLSLISLAQSALQSMRGTRSPQIHPRPYPRLPLTLGAHLLGSKYLSRHGLFRPRAFKPSVMQPQTPCIESP